MASSIVELGRLELVELRKAWPDEAANFTPWLAEQANLTQLGDELGLSLELEAVEKQVGPFSADILAKDQDTQQWVLIENQIAPTDHRHLGQVLTYAAGLDARTVIWIAESFREEHRAAIDFPNRATISDYNFFAIQIQLYRIGDSPLAPHFSIVAKPNDWNKQVQEAKEEVNDTQKLNLEYWTMLIERSVGKYPALAQRSAGRQNWQQFERLRGGDLSVVVNGYFSWDRGLRVEVYIDLMLAKAAFRALSLSKAAIESAVGAELAWEELPQARASRIALYMSDTEKRDKRENRDRWPAQQAWLLEWAPRLANGIRPFVAALDVALLKQQVDEAANGALPNGLSAPSSEQ